MNSKWVKRLSLVLSFCLVLSMWNTNMIVNAATKKKISVTKVKITKPDTSVLIMKKGSKYTLGYKVFPKNSTNKRVSFTSSNKKVATVSAKGVISANKSGTSKITVQTANKKKDSITVKVVIPVSQISLNKTNVVMKEGDSFRLKATISPSNATYQKISFKSSNSQVVRVTSTGLVKAKAKGVATITVKALDGSGVKKSCRVKVNQANPSPSNAYHLVFEDEFLGTELNMKNWNYETHDPGWVNNELQEYTDSKDNIYVKDGKLVIKANKTKKVVDGKEQDWYTSGKVTSKDKHDFKYGKFEIKAKAVEGKGLWPALWMMPREENFYGQWPRCGEIDIMEVLGHEPNKTYATIHYGNPHKEQQGTYVLKNGTFADDYHVYGLEWEPNEMRFYVDGNLIHTVNDWYTATEGKGEITYPAPFDQFFYLQFNLAVGGSWPGNPDEKTNFDNAKLMIDYVKVYQKDSYDENVTKPEPSPVVLREPDQSGNYIVNGDFSEQEDLNDDLVWGQKYANDGAGTVTIQDNKMIIKTKNEGNVDYSVQIVQPNLPMQKGGTYELTFDAWADEARTMIVDISGPDRSYVRYFEDTKEKLGPEKKSYKYNFTMTNDSDSNGRLEFNLGNQSSKATVYISNVKLIKTGQTEIKPPAKGMLADGNFVYNGEFQEGKDRMLYWTTTNPANATVSVTNDNGRRELMVKAPAGIASNDILVKQEVAISAKKTYVLTFDAYADTKKDIKVRIDGKTYGFTLTTQKQQFKKKFTTREDITEKELIFALGVKGVTFLDNVRLAEDGLLINGDFINDLNGWNPFVDSSITSQVSYTVDSQKEEQAAAFEIANTGDADWKIQLMQDGIHMEKGKKYHITFDAKTDLAGGRDIMYAIQHNGSSDDNWTGYLPSTIIKLTDTYQKFEATFTMESDSDEAARLSFSMGAVGGKQITKTHNVYIDNVTLEEVKQ